MKLLLCSDFKNMGYMYLDKFFNLDEKHTCLFINYASDDYIQGDAEYTSSSMERIKSLNFDIVSLDKGYDFKDRIDMIFVRGGNTTKLLHLLKEYNQFDKIESLARGGVLYIGESAGSVLAGSDTEWTLEAEPYDFDMKGTFGQDALKGYGFVDKMVFVHCSKLRFPYSGESPDGKLVRYKNTDFYGSYLRDIRRFEKGTYITLGNNQVYYENDNQAKILTYDWSNIPVEKSPWEE